MLLRMSVLSKRPVLVHLAGQKALAQRTEGDEADAEFFKQRNDFLFRLAIPQRIFALQRRYRLHSMRAPDRLSPGL